MGRQALGGAKSLRVEYLNDLPHVNNNPVTAVSSLSFTTLDHRLIPLPLPPGMVSGWSSCTYTAPIR